MLELTLDNKHTYRLGGERLPGVTTILHAAGFMPSSEFIDPWYMERGSMIHRATELHDRGTLDESTVDERIKGYLESWKKLDRAYSAEQIEVRLCDTLYLYAGTIDRLPLCDIKSGGPEPWHTLQLGAYYGLCKASMLNRELFISPHAIYLQEDGSLPKVKRYTLPEISAALNTFLCALNVYQWRKNNKLLKEDV